MACENRGTDRVHLPLCDIILPDFESPDCVITVDLAALFNAGSNEEAIDRFRSAWRSRRLKGRIRSDQEAASVLLYGGRDAIVEAAVLIHDLAGQPLGDHEVSSTRSTVRSWTRPSAPVPRDWTKNDVVAIPLDDRSFGFCQILELRKRPGQIVEDYPLVVIFDCTFPSPAVDPEEVVTSRAISAVEDSWRFLCRPDFVRVGNIPALVSPDRAQGAKEGCFLSAEWIARAWFGHVYWNEYQLSETLLDRHLLSGVARSSRARFLSEDEKARIRRGDAGLPSTPSLWGGF